MEYEACIRKRYIALVFKEIRNLEQRPNLSTEYDHISNRHTTSWNHGLMIGREREPRKFDDPQVIGLEGSNLISLVCHVLCEIGVSTEPPNFNPVITAGDR